MTQNVLVTLNFDSTFNRESTGLYYSFYANFGLYGVGVNNVESVVFDTFAVVNQMWTQTQTVVLTPPSSPSSVATIRLTASAYPTDVFTNNISSSWLISLATTPAAPTQWSVADVEPILQATLSQINPMTASKLVIAMNPSPIGDSPVTTVNVTFTRCVCGVQCPLTASSVCNCDPCSG